MTRISEHNLSKLDPRLRMVANGNEVVNTLRAERDPSIIIDDERLLRDVPILRDPEARPVDRSRLPASARRGSLKQIPGSVHANVFVRLMYNEGGMPAALRRKHAGKPVRKHNLVAASVPLDKLPELLSDPAVITVEKSEQVTFLPPVDVSLSTAEPAPRWKAFEQSVNEVDSDHGPPRVLVGIVDVQGFDFAHPDFLDKHGNTRFVRIWDQGGGSRPAPRRYAYGSELTADHMNAAIQAASNPRFALPATQLEPQSQMAPSSHATHVASIAAGGRGVCPRALIAGVLISLPDEDTDRRRSFYDSTRIAHAVDYLFELGEELGLPVSINISLGTNGHAHDGSSITNRWIDYELTTAGRSVCVAAGNAGQEKPVEPGDWGYVMGRIHSGGDLSQEENQTAELYWMVVGDGIADLSENEMEIWYSPGDRFSVEIKPPDHDWIGPVAAGEYIENLELKPNGTFVSIYNEIYSPSNGCNYIACYLSPFFSPSGVVGVRAGQWIVKLTAQSLRDGDFHAWIERDDPRRYGRMGTVDAWSFPSFFAEHSNVDETSVGSLACGSNILSVANLDEENSRIHITSSQGPTRDGRHKPDIAAPGTRIVAANGFDTDPWVAMTGTSMASPYVAGVVACMLEEDPTLTAAQVAGILRRTAAPLADGSFRWINDSGFGKINPQACMEEVRLRNTRKELNP